MGIVQANRNRFHYAIEVVVDIRIPETKNAKATSFEKRIANLIVALLLGTPMLSAVSLNHNLSANETKSTI